MAGLPADAPPPRPDGVPPLRPRRRITGCAAVLLPFLDPSTIDWAGFGSLMARTVEAGLVPAVDMDTGYVQLLEPADRQRVLEVAADVAGPGFLAGAFVDDAPGDPFDAGAYEAAMGAVVAAGGTPVVFPSWGLNALGPDEWVAAHQRFASHVERFVAFELGPQFVPYGRIYPIEAYRGLLGIDACVGAKHSSLSRRAEWDRLVERDRRRPDFAVFTGNDLAIDMVCYGSDYLLGLAAFAPDLFARRDACWAAGDADFHELNDRLQYLGAFSFRAPVPAYRHDAATFLHLRGWIDRDAVPRGAPTRPPSDRPVLEQLARDLGVLA